MKLRIYECQRGLYIVTDRETNAEVTRLFASNLQDALDKIDAELGEEHGELDRETLIVHLC